MRKTILMMALVFQASQSMAAQPLPQSSLPEVAVGIAPVYSDTTRIVCGTSQTPAQGQGWIGQALGAVLGAGVGSQIGSGKGNTIATAAGAALGGQAGAALGSGQALPEQQECRQIVDRRLDGYSIGTDQGRRVFVPLQVMQSIAR